MKIQRFLAVGGLLAVFSGPVSADGLLGGAIKGFGQLIGSEEIKQAGENLDRLHAQIKDQLPVYKGIEEGGSRIVREVFVQPCIAPFQAITKWSMATAGFSSAASRQKVDEAIGLLVRTGVLNSSELNGVSMRWSSLSGAHGMAPDRNVILLDTAYRGESTIVTNPLEPDHDSATKPISVPLGSRSPFRTEADRDSAGKPITFRPLAER